jgi:3-hydroxyisobutyrate dehydrogenase
MGSRMAARLLDAGHELHVYNRTAERTQSAVDRGADGASTPREAASRADVVVSMVSDDEAARSVWLDPKTGAIAGLRPGATVIESSTVTPGWIAELGDVVADAGARLLDAPVVGSRPQAEAGQLIYLVGGDSGIVDRVRPILEAMGQSVLHVGEPGNGAVMKLLVNDLFGVQVAALAEMLGMATRAGIEAPCAIEVLGQLPVTSPAVAGVGRLIANGDFDPMFPIDLVTKDFGYVLDTAERVGAEVPLASATSSAFGRAKEAGFGADNIAAVARLYLGPQSR